MTETQALSEKFQEWDSTIKKYVLERNKEARGIVIATLARAHHLQLGPPGTAKSYLVNTALKMVDGARTMSIQLHGYSLIEDMYGPISMTALKKDRYVRQTETYVPWADFVFADEVFKANPTLLNSNLLAFNERRFRNDGKMDGIPLISGFFASNEGPEDPTLQAFDDRIHLRYEVAPIREAATRLAMFRGRLNRQEPEPIITIEDVRRAHEFVDAVEIPDFVLETLNDLHDSLSQVQIVPTDRKLNDALKIIQATAFFNGRSRAVVDDMSMLSHMFWSNSKDIPTVAEKVYDLANPLDKKALSLRNEIEAIALKVEDVVAIQSKTQRVRKATDLHEKLEEANNELLALRKQADAEGTKSEVVEETKQRLNSVAKRLLVKGFRESVDDTEGSDG